MSSVTLSVASSCMATSHYPPQPVFPPEICDKIIDLCSQHTWLLGFAKYQPEREMITKREQHAALCNCALVSRSWNPRSTIHLYRDVFIEHDSQIVSLVATLTSRPEYLELIEDLILYLCPSPKKTPWSYHLLSLLLAPFTLPSLSTISIRWCGGKEMVIGPKTHTSFFMAWGAFSRIRRLNLLSVIFKNLSSLTRLIASFSSLDYLALVGCNFLRGNGDPRTTGRRIRSRIRVLKITVSTSPLALLMLHWIASQSEMTSRLESLTFQHDGAMEMPDYISVRWNRLAFVLQSVSASLRRLSCVQVEDLGAFN